MKGSCLCGSVAYELLGDILGVNYCHCAQCRKASGTAFATSAAVRQKNFKIVKGHEHVTAYESSPGKKRYFCECCGSPLYSRREGASTIYIRLGTLDDDPIVRPNVHIHVASKAPWYEIKDDLPQLDAEEGLWF